MTVYYLQKQFVTEILFKSNSDTGKIAVFGLNEFSHFPHFGFVFPCCLFFKSIHNTQTRPVLMFAKDSGEDE